MACDRNRYSCRTIQRHVRRSHDMSCDERDVKPQHVLRLQNISCFYSNCSTTIGGSLKSQDMDSDHMTFTEIPRNALHVQDMSATMDFFCGRRICLVIAKHVLSVVMANAHRTCPKISRHLLRPPDMSCDPWPCPVMTRHFL